MCYVFTKMASAEIQVVNPENLQKIESFLNDSSYKDAIENSSNFNTRLCVERRLRMPFLDPQTGVAQNHCNLFMSRRQRMPGLREGQIYTYPSTRWRKARRQYLSLQRMGWGSNAWESAAGAGVEAGGDDSSGLPGVDSAANEDSRDGEHTGLKDDPKDSWFYDDLVEDMEQTEDAEQESDEDYFDDTYANRRRGRGGGGGPGSAGGAGPGRRGRRGGGGRGAGTGASPAPPDDATPKGRGRAGGRGRRRAAQGTLPYEVAGDADKPYGCELCGARYKTRPGLTYHYTHSHKEGSAGAPSVASDGDSRDSGAAPSPAPAVPSPAPAVPPPAKEPPATPSTTASKDLASSEYQDSYVTFLNNPAAAAAAAAAASTSSAVRRGRAPGIIAGPSAAGASTGVGGATVAPPASPPPSAPARAASPAAPVPPAVAASNEDSNASDDSQATDAGTTKPDPAVKGKKNNASPSPYCDFCLGDNSENKKTGTPEDLVSCSDCGRSGHPTCLQFTVNMIVSVRKYRWQCIECKCCSVCGNSDNDDQLLFCDDCDRGYHMYCLAPPLASPPEGSWSCKLCLQEFHGK